MAVHLHRSAPPHLTSHNPNIHHRHHHRHHHRFIDIIIDSLTNESGKLVTNSTHCNKVDKAVELSFGLFLVRPPRKIGEFMVSDWNPYCHPCWTVIAKYVGFPCVSQDQLTVRDPPKQLKLTWQHLNMEKQRFREKRLSFTTVYVKHCSPLSSS